MATEIHLVDFTIPAGTPKSALASTTLTFPNLVVDEIEVVVPPGPRGEVGFGVGTGGVVVIPRDANTFVVTDDEVIHWPLEGFWDSGSWTFFGYNTGNFPHTLEFRLLCTRRTAPGTQGQPLALENVPLSAPEVPSVPTSPLGPPAPPLPPSPPGPPVSPTPTPAQGPPPQAVVEDTELRFAKYTRADGTVDFLILLNDGTLLHYWTSANTVVQGKETLPGSWVAITEFGTYQQELYVRGVGLDSSIWQTQYTPGKSTQWDSPTKVLA